jgi:hypothetical protein
LHGKVEKISGIYLCHNCEKCEGKKRDSMSIVQSNLHVTNVKIS